MKRVLFVIYVFVSNFCLTISSYAQPMTDSTYLKSTLEGGGGGSSVDKTGLYIGIGLLVLAGIYLAYRFLHKEEGPNTDQGPDQENDEGSEQP